MNQKLPIRKNGERGQLPAMFNPFNYAPFGWGSDMANAVQRNMMQMFDDVYDAFPAMGMGLQAALPAADISEDKKGVIVTMMMPGIDKDDIDISEEDGMLTVEAVKRERKNGTESEYSFSHSVSLPDGVDIDNADVSLSGGKLCIEIPKDSGGAQKLQINKNGNGGRGGKGQRESRGNKGTENA